MKNKLKLYLTLWVVLFTFLNVNAQCETIMKFFKDDVYTSKELVAFAEKNPQKAFDSWKVLYHEKNSLTKNLEELTLVSKNLEAIKSANGYLNWKALQGAGNLLDNALIAQMRAGGVTFTEANLKFVAKNNDNLIMFLEKGNPSSGLQHIIDGKWTGKPSFQALFNNNVDEMVENMYRAVKEGNYLEKIIDNQNRLSYVYKVQTTQGLKEFKFATGSNGYIVSFIPNWP